MFSRLYVWMFHLASVRALGSRLLRVARGLAPLVSLPLVVLLRWLGARGARRTSSRAPELGTAEIGL